MHGLSWAFMDFHGGFMGVRAFKALSWAFIAVSRDFIDFMGVHGHSWDSVGFHGLIWAFL